MKLPFNIHRFLLLTVLVSCLMPVGYANSVNKAASQSVFRQAPDAPIVRKRSPLVHLTLSPRQAGKLNCLTDVYAAMEWEVSSTYEDDYTYIENWNYFIRYYSDAGGTTPLELPANLTVYYQWNYTATDGYGHWTEAAQSVQGDTQYEIPDVQVYYSDPNYYYEVVLWLVDGTGYIRLN